ncbi:MAG: pentapeptide repeat-containing protein [Cyanobacteria bacterium K_Offshore_surface_m2_239]|nr:pentapeptide repeat-containing protein [Cyanobacteria bacterium K_Offshore_surface_m2_239]
MPFRPSSPWLVWPLLLVGLLVGAGAWQRSNASRTCRPEPRVRCAAADFSALEWRAVDLRRADLPRGRWIGTQLERANLRGADLNGVVMLRGSLRRARLEAAHTNSARWLGVGFQHTRCPDGSSRSIACPGFVVPRTATAEREALARVAWLRDLPWPAVRREPSPRRIQGTIGPHCRDGVDGRAPLPDVRSHPLRGGLRHQPLDGGQRASRLQGRG